MVRSLLMPIDICLRESSLMRSQLIPIDYLIDPWWLALVIRSLLIPIDPRRHFWLQSVDVLLVASSCCIHVGFVSHARCTCRGQSLVVPAIDSLLCEVWMCLCAANRQFMCQSVDVMSPLSMIDSLSFNLSMASWVGGRQF